MPVHKSLVYLIEFHFYTKRKANFGLLKIIRNLSGSSGRKLFKEFLYLISLQFARSEIFLNNY